MLVEGHGVSGLRRFQERTKLDESLRMASPWFISVLQVVSSSKSKLTPSKHIRLLNKATMPVSCEKENCLACQKFI